jgi:hypothetical protein
MVGLMVLAGVLSGTLVTDAAGPALDAPAAVAQPAVSVASTVAAVSVYQTGQITAPVRDAALAAAADVGAPAVVGRGFSVGLTRVRRGAAVIQQAEGAGWAFPMAVTALPLDAIGAVMGRSVSGPISEGQVVMGQTSAAIRGAQAGDVIDVVAANGTITSFAIGAIAPDAQVGGTEIVMTVDQASALGAVYDTRVLIYGPVDTFALHLALVDHGLTTNSKVRIRQTWDPPDPDDTLSLAVTKSLLGEFDYYYAGLSTSGWTAMSAGWRNQYLPAAREAYPTGIRALCNKVIKADLTAALQEVVSSGLGGGIDAANANQYGGCATGQVRFARLTQNLGSVSRHSWGQPLDTNTTTNCQGCVPQMDCRIVRIFRKHHFAWGGNFLTSDGMHFEWVGQQRNTLQYPSRYCPNLPNGNIQSSNPPSPGSRATLFAGDGWAD